MGIYFTPDSWNKPCIVAGYLDNTKINLSNIDNYSRDENTETFKDNYEIFRKNLEELIKKYPNAQFMI